MRKTLFCLLALLIGVNMVSGTTYKLYPTEDTMIAETVPGANYGTATEMMVGQGGAGAFYSYLKFNLSPLPPSKIPIKGDLVITPNRSAPGGYANRVYARMIYNETWQEEELIWTNRITDAAEYYDETQMYNYTNLNVAGTSGRINVSEMLYWYYGQGRVNFSLMLRPEIATTGLISYYNTSDASGNRPYLELELIDSIDNVQVNVSNTLPAFGMGMNSHFTNTTDDISHTISALQDTGGGAIVVVRQWDIYEPTNVTRFNPLTTDWTGLVRDHGREDEYYNGEWHNGTVAGAVLTVKATNPTNPPLLVLKLVSPPSWIKDNATGSKNYPLRNDSYYDIYYAWRSLTYFIVTNLSYPANKIIIAPVNEAYGNMNTSVWNASERYINLAYIMRAAADGAHSVSSNIRVMGFLDNDPDLSYTEEFFAQNSSWAQYFDILSINNYLHSGYDYGYSAWDASFNMRENPWGREWDLRNRDYSRNISNQAWTLIAGNASGIDELWVTEMADKDLAYNDPIGTNNNIGSYNNTNSALWLSSRLAYASRERYNRSVIWSLLPLLNLANGITDVGWGIMAPFQSGWTKYAAYNVTKYYDRYGEGHYPVNFTNSSLDDSRISIGVFKNSTGRDSVATIIGNKRNYHSNFTLNFTNLSFTPKNLRVYSLLNDTILQNDRFTESSVTVNISANDSKMYLLFANDDTFTWSGESVSEPIVYQSSQATDIRVTVNDSDGTIMNVSVGLMFNGVETNYSLSLISGDQWGGSFKFGTPGAYSINRFYAMDNDFGTDSHSYPFVITVVPVVTGGTVGGTGGGSAGVSVSPISQPANGTNITGPPVPDTGINIKTLAEDPLGNMVLQGLALLGMLMMVLGIRKNGKVSTFIFGLMFISLSASSLGWV